MTETLSIPRQREHMKFRYPNTLILFRLGDFLEAYDRDAEIIAAELDTLLTARTFDKQRVPMTGIARGHEEASIAQLVSAGHKVLVCERHTA